MGTVSPADGANRRENLRRAGIPSILLRTSKASDASPPASEKASSLVSLSAGSETRLLRAVHGVYRRWAFFVVAHAWKIIAACSLLTAICTVKILFTPQRNEITGYTPYGARSLAEMAARERFFDQTEGPPFGVLLLILPRQQGANLLDADALTEIIRVDDLMRHNFTLHNHVTSRNESFAEFCADFCDLNEPVRHFYNGYRLQLDQLRRNESLYSRIDLRYPVSIIFGRRFSVQPNFFDVNFTSANRRESNETAMTVSEAAHVTNIARLGVATLAYKAERVGKWTDEEVKAFEISVTRYFENDFQSDTIRVLTVSTTYVEYEVVRAGMSMLPFLLVGFAIMAVCSSTTVFLSAAYFQQVNIHKFALALMACVCPFMACGTALGLLFFGGLRFGSVLCVTPFLVLAIGVDDAYLMIHSWQRVVKEMRDNPTKLDSVAHRLSLVLVDTGPAILISALTNVGADAVGSFTSSPEVTLLCVGNMASILVDFIYQVSFYAAFVAIVGQYEMRDEAQAAYKLSIPIGASVLSVDAIPSMTPDEQRQDTRRTFRERVETRFEAFVSGYVRLITNAGIAALICVAWLAFFIFALVGITRFEVDLTTKKIFAGDSPLLTVDHYREEHIVPFYTMASVFVEAPGDLGDPARLARLDAMVAALEGMPESWGSDSTNFFLRDFFAYQAQNEETAIAAETNEITTNRTQFSAVDLKHFLEWPEYAYWRGFVHFDTDSRNKTRLASFFFTTAYHADRLRIWAERTRLLQRWRAVVDAFPEFHASVFHDEGIFLDLIDNMPTDAWQSALATLLCMSAICTLFMCNAFTVGVASAVIASIIVGTLGLLSWQNVTMDPIMMAALVISVGFSIDIPAHVTYHYYSSGFEAGASVRDRLKSTFASVGFPALQASASTSLCVLSLLFVKLYMARIFVRIMCSCIALCVVHSLIVLPAVFALVDWIRRTVSAYWRRRWSSASNAIAA